jgi:cytochrome c-type biogenesis protein CcmE
MLEFDVKDDEGNIFHVSHNGVKPDNFNVEGVTVILQGYLDASKQGSFNAETVKTRCPSKYEGQDMKNYDPEMHKEMSK